MKRNNFFLLLIIFLGFFLRFYRLEQTAMFIGDQGRDYLAARDILVNHQLTVVGPQTSISWLYLGPFFYYFLAFFLWLGNFNPLWPVYGTAVFGVLAIYLIYLLGKALFDQQTGLLAALMYAVSPFAVIQSRIALHPSVYPFFVILFLIIWRKILILKKYSESKLFTFCFLLFVFFSVAIQLHLSAVLLIPIAVLSWEQIKLKTRFFLKFFLVTTGILVIWKVFKNSPFTPVTYWWKIFEEIFSFGYSLGAILALGIVIWGIFGVISEVRGGSLLLKSCLLVIVFGLTVKNSQAEHYFNLFLPIIIEIFSFGLVWLLNKRWGKTIILLVTLSFLVINCHQLLASDYFSQIYGPGLLAREKLARFIVADAQDKPIVLKRCGPLWDYPSTNLNYEYFVWWLGKERKKGGSEGEVTYYILEPKGTKEGCEGVEGIEGEKFDFGFAEVLKVKG